MPRHPTPAYDRRTYGLFRGRDLLAVFVSGVFWDDGDCVEWGTLYGKGLTVFALHTHDVTVRPDFGWVIEGLKSQYTFEVIG